MQHVRADSLFKSKRLGHEDPQGMHKDSASPFVVLAALFPQINVFFCIPRAGLKPVSTS
jgi:hypothetical protein